MSARPETREGVQTPEEQAEFGKRVYDTMALVATTLLDTPEFTDALGQAFFARPYGAHDRNEIRSVYFEKGGFNYLIERYGSRYEPRSHGEPERRDLITSHLEITKYDPHEFTEHHIGPWLKKVSSIEFNAAFLEDSDGGILRFTDGTAILSEAFDLETSWERPPSWGSAKPTKVTEGPAALNRLPEVFAGVLYPVPTVIL